MPINPEKTKFVFYSLVDVSSCSNASFGNGRKATPSVRNASPASSSCV